MISELDIQNIIELDRINMQPILDKHNIKFDCKLRENGIRKEIENGAEFIFLENECDIIAYLEYLKVDDNIFKIPSIQIHPNNQNGFTLLKLLNNSLPILKENYLKKVTSSVHKSNKPSLKLHQKLGFGQVSESSDRVELEISAELLIYRIEHYSKRIKNK